MNMLTIQTSENWQPEKEYAFYVLLHEILGLDYRIEYQQHTDKHTFRLPHGAELRFEDGFSGYSIPGTATLPLQWNPITPAPSSDWPVPDVFAATFFMLTRWEETASPDRDRHGRFPAEGSVAWKQGFLQRPVVNEWADWLWNSLLRLGWKGEQKQRKFKISLSCDVDHPLLWWSATDRIKTLAGAIFKRKNLPEAAYWLKNHIFQSKDPYDVFDDWFDLLEQHNHSAQFNFMGERPRSSDCWYPVSHPFVRQLMQKIADRGHKIGFHPSYESFDHPDLFQRELDSLRTIAPIEISAGRQHYLRFAAPRTWNSWEAAGLREDSTLGYPEAEGFRCGICHDFPVFDTLQRKMLRLREKPLIAMDVTLAQYRPYSPEQAFSQLMQLRREVEKYGGDFTLLWHNSSWNTPAWEPWKEVFYNFISR